MDTPRKTKLYNQIAKDYTPKQAEMQICKYIEGLEARIVELEDKFSKVPDITALESRFASLEKALQKSKPSTALPTESK